MTNAQLTLSTPRRSHAAADSAGPGRTLAVTASATLLVLAVFSSGVTTVGDTARSVHAGVSGQTWALSAMSLGLAAALLTVGALADDLGRRRVLVWSSGLLAMTSALAALAPSMGVFVVARALQGAAGAGVIAASLAMIGHAFREGHSRTHATGVWGAALGAGIAIGPLAAAGLADVLDWRSGYWAQAIAAALLIPAAASLGESRSAEPRPLDLPGALTLGTGMALITGGFVEGRTNWSSSTTIALLAAGALLLGSFVLHERRSRAPMLDLHLFRNPSFVASLSGALFTGVAIIGLMSYSPSLYQRGLGMSVLGSATVLLAWSATSVVVALGARRLPAALRSHVRLAIGLALAAVGEVALTGLGVGSSWPRLVPGLLLAGVGSGLANAALGRLALESVPRERAGMGSGANNTARYIGGAAGVALVVVVVSAAGGSAGPGALMDGWNAATLVCAALCALGALVAVACRPRTDAT
ncbi:MAG TPA: MFS transporter [Thermoleophilaceae bacterium]|jgi:MFS family permease